MAELLRFVQKSKMAAAAILNWYFATLDHPRSLLHGQKAVLKFHVNRFSTFRDMAIWRFCKFGLKCLFQPPKFTFLGVLTPNIIFSSSRPSKGTSLAETAHFEPLSVAIGPAVSPGGRTKNTKKQRENRKVTGKTGCWPRPRPLSDFNHFWHVGSPPGPDSKIWVSGRSLPKFSSYGGQKSPISYSSHIAYTTVLRYRVHCEKGPWA